MEDSQTECLVCGKRRETSVHSPSTDSGGDHKTPPTHEPVKTPVPEKHGPFSFKGRADRTDYWIATVIYAAISFGLQSIAQAAYSSSVSILCGVALIPLFWYYLAQGAKRCHDRGNSGWYQIIPFYALWMLFGKGEPYTNEYGPCPE